MAPLQGILLNQGFTWNQNVTRGSPQYNYGNYNYGDVDGIHAHLADEFDQRHRVSSHRGRIRSTSPRFLIANALKRVFGSLILVYSLSVQFHK